MIGDGSRPNNSGINNQNSAFRPNQRELSGIYANPIQSLAKQGIIRCQDLSQDEAWGRFAFRGSTTSSSPFQVQCQTPASLAPDRGSQRLEPRISAQSPKLVTSGALKQKQPVKTPDGFGGFILREAQAQVTSPKLNSQDDRNYEHHDWKVVGSGRRRRVQPVVDILPKQQAVIRTNGNQAPPRTVASTVASNQDKKPEMIKTGAATVRCKLKKTEQASLAPGQFLPNTSQTQTTMQKPSPQIPGPKKIRRSKSLKQMSRASLPILAESFNKVLEKCHLSPKTKSTSFSVGQVRNLSGTLLGHPSLTGKMDPNSRNIGGKGSMIGTRVSPFGFGLQMPKDQFSAPHNFHFPRSPSASTSSGGSPIRSQGSISSTIQSFSQKRSQSSPTNHTRNISASTASNSVYSCSSSYYQSRPPRLSRAKTLIHVYEPRTGGTSASSRESFSKNELGAPFTLEDSPYSVCLREIEDENSDGKSGTFAKRRVDGKTQSSSGSKDGQPLGGNGSHELKAQALNQLQLQHKRQSFARVNKAEESKFSYAAVAKLASTRSRDSDHSPLLHNRTTDVKANNQRRSTTDSLYARSGPILNAVCGISPSLPTRTLPQCLIPSSPSLTVASNASTSLLTRPKNPRNPNNPNLINRSFPMHGSLSQSSNGNSTDRDGKKVQVVSQLDHSNSRGKKGQIGYRFPQIAPAGLAGSDANGRIKGISPQEISHPGQIGASQVQRNPVSTNVLQKPDETLPSQTPMTQRQPSNSDNRQKIYHPQQPTALPSSFFSPSQMHSRPQPSTPEVRSGRFSPLGASTNRSEHAQLRRLSALNSQARPVQGHQPAMAARLTSSSVAFSSSSAPTSPLSSSNTRPHSNLVPLKHFSESRRSIPISNLGHSRTEGTMSQITALSNTPRRISTPLTPRATSAIQSSQTAPPYSRKPSIPPSAQSQETKQLTEREIDEGERSEDEAGKLWRSLEQKLGTNLDCGPKKKELPRPTLPSPVKALPTGKTTGESGNASAASLPGSTLANRRKVVNVPRPIEVINVHQVNSRVKASIAQAPKSAPLPQNPTTKHNETLKDPTPQSAGLSEKTFSSISDSTTDLTRVSSTTGKLVSLKKAYAPSRIPRPIKRIQTGTSKMLVLAPVLLEMPKSNSKSAFSNLPTSGCSTQETLEKNLDDQENETLVLPCQLKEVRTKSIKVVAGAQEATENEEVIPKLITSPRRGGISISRFQNSSESGLASESDSDTGARNLAKAFAEAELELEKVDITLSEQRKLREEMHSNQETSSGDDFSQESGSDSSSSDEDEVEELEDEEEKATDPDDELNQIVLRFPSPVMLNSRKDQTSVNVAKKSSISSLSFNASSTSANSTSMSMLSPFQVRHSNRCRPGVVTQSSSQSIVSLLRTDSVMKNSETDFTNDRVFRESGDYVKVPTHWSRLSWRERKEMCGEEIEG